MEEWMMWTVAGVVYAFGIMCVITFAPKEWMESPEEGSPVVVPAAAFWPVLAAMACVIAAIMVALAPAWVGLGLRSLRVWIVERHSERREHKAARQQPKETTPYRSPPIPIANPKDEE